MPFPAKARRAKRFRRYGSEEEPRRFDIQIGRRPGLVEVIVIGELDMANGHRVRDAHTVREPDENLILNLGRR